MAPSFCGEGCLSVIKPTARGAWCSQNALEIRPESLYACRKNFKIRTREKLLIRRMRLHSRNFLRQSLLWISIFYPDGAL